MCNHFNTCQSQAPAQTTTQKGGSLWLTTTQHMTLLIASLIAKGHMQQPFFDASHSLQLQQAIALLILLALVGFSFDFSRHQPIAQDLSPLTSPLLKTLSSSLDYQPGLFCTLSAIALSSTLGKQPLITTLDQEKYLFCLWSYSDSDHCYYKDLASR